MIEKLYVPAEMHLLASGKRDAANLLAEMMFDWYVASIVSAVHVYVGSVGGENETSADS